MTLSFNEVRETVACLVNVLQWVTVRVQREDVECWTLGLFGLPWD